MIATYDDPDKRTPDEQAARIVVDRYEKAKRNNQIKKPERDDWYAAYRSYYKSDKKLPFRSKLFIPTTFEHLESHLPRLAAARPRIEVWPRNPEDENRARAQRALIYYFWDSLRMDIALINYAKAALIYGTSWWKVEWRRKTHTAKRQVEVQQPVMSLYDEPVAVQTVTEEQEYEVREIDSPVVYQVEPDDLYFDEDGWCEQTAEWIIDKTQMTLKQLEDSIKPDGSPLYDKAVLDTLREKAKGGNPVMFDASEANDRKDLLNRATSSSSGEIDPYKIQFTVLTEWTDEKVRAVIEEDPSIGPIRNEENELHMKPFIKYTPIPLPNEMNGISMAETLFSIQYSQNLLNNARMDNVMQSVHSMHTVRLASGITPSQLRYRPGGTVPVINHDDVQPLQPSRLDFTHYREAEYLDGLAQKTSGSTDIYRGIGAGSGATATESSILAQSAASRVGLMFQILSAQPLHRLGKLWIRMSELYMDRPRMLRITGPEMMAPEPNPATGKMEQPVSFEVTPEELQSGSEEELDLIIDVSQTEPGTRQFKLQRAQQLLQTVGGLVAPSGPVMNRILKNALEGLGDDNADQILAEEQQYIQAQQQAALQQQAQVGGGNDAQQLAQNASQDAGRGDQL